MTEGKGVPLEASGRTSYTFPYMKILPSVSLHAEQQAKVLPLVQSLQTRIQSPLDGL